MVAAGCILAITPKRETRGGEGPAEEERREGRREREQVLRCG